MKSFLFFLGVLCVAWPCIGMFLAMLVSDEERGPKEKKEIGEGIALTAFILSFGMALLLAVEFSRHQ